MSSFIPPSPVLDPRGVSVLGSGPFASAVSTVMLSSGARVRVYARHLRQSPNLVERFPGLELTDDLAHAVKEASLLVFAVPAEEMDALSEGLGAHVFPDQIAMVASRGLSHGFRMPYEYVQRHTCIRKIGVLGGPFNVGELSAGRRINVVLATRFSEVATRARAMTQSVAISFESTQDLLGVSIAGSIANVASIAVGMANQLGYGATAQGVLQARGIFEASRLGVDAGADPATFGGLAGLGELIPREVQSMRRHETLGKALARGELSAGNQLEDVVTSEMGGHIEGVLTAAVASQRARERGLECPLLEGIDAILKGEADVAHTLETILSIPLGTL